MKKIIFLMCSISTILHPNFSLGQCTGTTCAGCPPAGSVNLPPQHLVGGTSLCSTAPWDLVWYDEFNGYTDGSGYHNDLNPLWWEKDNTGNGSYYKLASSNVTVDGGILYLDSWQVPGFDNSPYGEGHYTCSWLRSITYPTMPTQLPLFTSGKFEARISYPSYYFSHSNFELTGLNEGVATPYPVYDLSIAEAYGAPVSIFWDDLGLSFHEHITAGFGSGCPGPSTTNTETIVSNTYCEEHAVFENYHTYGFEWDENYEYWSYDGEVIKINPKYSAIPTTDCVVPATGTYAVNASFPVQGAWPWTSTPDGMFISLSSYIDRDYFRHTGSPYELGAMKVDWVKVYQRSDNIQKGLNNLCDRYITGVTSFCDDKPHTYTIEGTGGTSISSVWNWTTSSNLIVISQTINSITVKANPTGTGSPAFVTFTDDNPECPTITYNFNIGITAPTTINAVISGVETGSISLYQVIGTVLSPQPLTSYIWSFDNVPSAGFSGFTYTTLTGLTVSDPIYYGEGTTTWHVHGENTCGTGPSKTGSIYKKWQHPIWPSDNHVNGSRLSSYNNDSTTNVDEEDISQLDTRVFPNPVSNQLNVVLGSQYSTSKEISLKIIDQQGRTLNEQKTSDPVAKAIFNTSGLARGIYYLQITSTETNETIKFTK